MLNLLKLNVTTEQIAKQSQEMMAILHDNTTIITKQIRVLRPDAQLTKGENIPERDLDDDQSSEPDSESKGDDDDDEFHSFKSDTARDQADSSSEDDDDD